MAMFFYVITLLAYFNHAASRDVGKMMRQGPSISNSLVNLGKMDISFYIGKPSDLPVGKTDYLNFLPNVQIPRPQTAVEPCPCSEFKSKMDNIFTHPSEIINKILMNKDFFKSPSSPLCCDSHEQIHEDTFVFELTPNDFNRGPMKLPTLPIERMIKPLKPQIRPKSLDIFLFPKRKDLANFEFMKQSLFKEPVKKDEIKKVGKEIQPFTDGSSVKKDLAVMEKIDETKKEDDKPATQNSV